MRFKDKAAFRNHIHLFNSHFLSNYELKTYKNYILDLPNFIDHLASTIRRIFIIDDQYIENFFLINTDALFIHFEPTQTEISYLDFLIKNENSTHPFISMDNPKLRVSTVFLTLEIFKQTQ